ncbi:MAG: hypothetical protein AAFS10_25630 [Myxococcota bacterium]
MTVLLMGAFGLRISIDAQEELRIATAHPQRVDLAQLESAARLNAPVASSEAARVLGQHAQHDDGDRARQALMAASRGARSWGDAPYTATLLTMPETTAVLVSADKVLGSPSSWARLMAGLALVGWLGGCVVWIAAGFDSEGELRPGRWRAAPVGIGLAFGAWLWAVWMV